MRWIVIASALLAFSAPFSGWADSGAESLNSQRLRAEYLKCERVSSRERIGPIAMAWCASVSDVLLRRDFGGDIERQLAWWRKARAEYTPPAARGQLPGSRGLDSDRPPVVLIP